MDEAPYYVKRQGMVEGPWPLSKLQSEAALRKLGRHDKVSRDGVAWRKAAEIDGLFVAPPKAAPKAMPDRDDELRMAPESNATRTTSSAREGNDARTAASSPSPVPSYQWFYCKDADSDHVGPFDTERLREGFASGSYSSRGILWREGFADWTAATEVPEFRDLFDSNDQDARRGGSRVRVVEQNYVPARRLSGTAVASLVVGTVAILASWIPLAGLIGLVAIGLGLKAVSDVRRSQGQLTGTDPATLGIVAGTFAALMAAVWALYIVVVVLPAWM